jgi:hypothetical protein
MDGLTLAQTVKNDPALAPTRIVILTTLLNRLNPAVMQATDFRLPREACSAGAPV